MFISDLEENIYDAAVSILKYLDNWKVISVVKSNEDIERTQKSLDNVYVWAEQNSFLKEDTLYFHQMLKV